MGKKFWILLLVLMLSFSSIVGAYADEIKDKKNQLNNSKDKQEELKDKIGNIKVEKKDITAQMEKLEDQIEKAQNDIDAVNDKIKLANGAIETTNNQLDSAIEDYNSEKGLYAERLKAMYINGPSGYLDVLLASENFSDFMARTEVVKTIIDYDKNLLTDMKDKQEKIEGKKAELETQRTQLSSLKKDYSSKKVALDKANDQKKEYYKELEKNQDTLEAALEREEKASKDLEKQIKDLQAKLAAQNKNTKYSGSKTGILKVSDIGHMPKVTSPYGNRFHPVLKKYKLHTGVDLGVPIGTPVYAMSDGVVLISGTNSAYGKMIVIDHGGGISSLYGHLSSLKVSVGDKVKKGQLIAKSGNTGYSTGPHLHFEIRKDGTPIDPNPYLIIGQ
jgi:murein DD-endopeptidase MepM/ murein hydrolase activator NlpD